MKKTTVLSALILCLSIFGNAQQIPSTFWGINHWMPKKYLNSPNIPNGKIESSAIQQLVQADGCIVYRVGGDGYDEYGTAIGIDTSSNDYIRAMRLIKQFNPSAKFLIQIPYKCGTFTPDSAAKLVQNIKNIYGGGHYYSIGNEWDRYRHSDTRKFITFEIANPIKAFAAAMKNVDPTCKIVAPPLSFESATDSLGQAIMPRLIGGADDITGLVTGTGNPLVDNIKYLVDVINIHSYGGSSGNLSTATSGAAFFTKRAGLMNYAGVSGQGHHQDLTNLISLLNTANSSRSSSPLTFAVTEMNVCYANQPTPVAGDKYTNTVEGISARSFFAGQHFADIMSTTLEKGTVSGSAKVEFVMPWSIHEGGGSGGSRDLGMTMGPGTTSAPTPLSSYYHYQLMAQHFFGRYYPSASNNLAPSVKAFASVEDSAGIYVMILNRDSVGHGFNLDLQNNTPSGKPLLLKFNIPALILPLDSVWNFNDTIGANETILLLYNCHGKRLWKMKYNLQDALNDGQPHFKMIGNKDVDPDVSSCETGIFEGEYSSNVSFSNQTLYITGDVLLTGTTKLTLDNVIAVISPGVQIQGGNDASIEIKNGTVMFGCDGPWQGIEMNGSYSSNESVSITNSYIYNALYPLKATQVKNITITGNLIANGVTGITLIESAAFQIDNNAIACFTTGIETENTLSNWSSSIKLNHLIHMQTGIKFEGDGHNMLDLSCNVINFTEYGVYSRSTTLADIGNSFMGAGNVFFKIGTTPADFIDHTGSATKYYIGPIETAIYTGLTVMNLTQAAALADGICAAGVLAAYTCKSLVNGITDQSPTQDNLAVYPNPGNGTFNLRMSDSHGEYKLTVHDILGREIYQDNVNFSADQNPTFEIKTKGLYILSLTNGMERMTRKIVVN